MNKILIASIVTFIWGFISHNLTKRIQNKTSPYCWEGWILLYAPIIVYLTEIFWDKYK